MKNFFGVLVILDIFGGLRALLFRLKGPFECEAKCGS